MEAGTFQLLKSEVQELTPELARAFHDMEPSPTERDMSLARLKYLREKAEAHQLISFVWAKALLNGKWVRVNGQHSSQMLVDLNGEFPSGLKVHLDEYEVADPQGLAQLFRQFDARKSGRSSADVAGAYQKIEPELQDVSRQIGKAAVEGVAWYRKNVAKHPTPQGDGQYVLFHELTLHDFIKWTNDVLSIKTPEFKPVGVMAAMYACFDAHETDARKFWELVARGGDQYDEESPATVLDEWLKRIHKKDDIEKLKAAQIYQGCIYASNAFRKGQSLKAIKYSFKSWLEAIGMAA